MEYLPTWPVNTNAMIPITSTLRVFTAPQTEPVTLDEAKVFLRVYTPFEDDLIANLLTAARQMVEQYLGRVLVTQTLLATYQLHRDYVAYRTGTGIWGWSGSTGSAMQYNGHLEFPRSPVQSVTSVTLRGHDLVDTAILNDAYDVDLEFDPGHFRLRWRDVSSLYPTVLMPLQHIQVKFVAGYGGTQYGETIPRPIIQAILLYLGHLYERRGDSESVIPDAIYALCNPYRLINFGGQ